MERKFFISTGEVSGDLHMSYLVKAMKEVDPETKFYGVGGKNLAEQGVELIQTIDELAIMGFSEAIKKISFLKEKAKEYVEYIKKNDIDSVILVDYGGFNVRFLKLLKEKLPHVKVYYYIPPKVWIWGKSRIKTLKLADELLVIFPWEVDFYRKEGVEVRYFGNPFMDKYGIPSTLGEKILCLPGSRKQEVSKLLPIILDIVKNNSKENFIIKLADDRHNAWAEELGIDFKDYDNLEVMPAKTSLEELVPLSRVAIAASGTITLELAILGLPTVVIYKTGLLNEFIGRYILGIKYISLPNLTLNEWVFPEVIQKDCTSVKIWAKVKELVRNEKQVIEKITEIRNILKANAEGSIIKRYASELLKGR